MARQVLRISFLFLTIIFFQNYGILRFEKFVYASDTETPECHFCGKRIIGKYLKYETGLIICINCSKNAYECVLCGVPMKKYYRSNIGNICMVCKKKVSKCSICTSVIKDYYQLEGKKICFECHKRLLKCDYCGTVEKKLNTFKNKKICEKCIKKFPECSACGNIMNAWHELKKIKLCKDCFVSLPKCKICRIPIHSSYMEQNKDKYCIQCYSDVPKCANCMLPVNGMYWSYNDADKVFCSKCEAEGKHCNICGIPTSRKYWELSDGRFVCVECNNTAVKDIKTASRLLNRAVSYIEKDLKMKVEHSSELTIVDSDKLKDLSDMVYKNHNLSGLFIRNNEKFDIFILYALPESLTLGVLAHEYAHAWQSENCPQDQSLLIKEGFAEWVCYKTLKYYGYHKEIKHMERRTDLYGIGFRRIKEMEEKDGVESVFEYIKSALQ